MLLCAWSDIFNENLDVQLQKTILNTHLVPSAREQWWFLHDNDKKFKSHLVQNYVHNAGIQLIDFPAYSPDLNPMENLWAIMAREVEKHYDNCPTIEILQDTIAELWKSLCIEYMQKLVASMPNRIAAVIATEGGHTDY